MADSWRIVWTERTVKLFTHSVFPSIGFGICVVKSPDPNGDITSYSYLDSYLTGTPPGNTDAYVTKITYPNTTNPQTSVVTAHSEQFSYNYADGQLAQSIDENQNPTSFKYNDSLGRLTETDFPDTGKKTISYDDSPPTISVTTTTLLGTGSNDVTVAQMDGMGHVINRSNLPRFVVRVFRDGIATYAI